MKEIKQIFIDVIHMFEKCQLIEEEALLLLSRSPRSIQIISILEDCDKIELKISHNLKKVVVFCKNNSNF